MGEHTNKVPVLKVESVQFVARLLGVHHFLIDDKGSTLGVVCDALADLPVILSVSMRVDANQMNRHWARIQRGFNEHTHLIGPNLPNNSKSSSAVTL